MKHFTLMPMVFWELREYFGIDEVMELSTIGIAIALNEIYEEVEFIDK